MPVDREGYGQPIINTAPQQVSFVVNSMAGSNAGRARNRPVARGVTVTPLRTQPPITQTQQIQKVLLKAVAKHDKKKTKTFTLRNINVAEVDTCSRLKALIRAQLREDITASEFDVGFISGTSVVSVRSEEDLAEIWSSQLKGDRVVLWCDGGVTVNERKLQIPTQTIAILRPISTPRRRPETEKIVCKTYLRD